MRESAADVVLRWTREGRRTVVATVVATKRSAPQPIGTKMLLDDRGQIWGAVSGGCVEGAVVAVGEAILAAGAPPQLLEYGIADADAWDVGLPCGGEIAVWVEAFAQAGPSARFCEIAADGGRAAVVTAIAGVAEPGAKLLVPADSDRLGTLGSAALDDAALSLARELLWSEQRGLVRVGDATLFVDVVAPPPRLVIVGAIDFAAQLAEVASLSGWRAFVVDPRARFATPERFPAAERVLVAWPAEAFAQLGPIDPATAIAVLTHDPKLDDAALVAALRSDAGYIGAMGSRRAQADRHARLLDAGVDPQALERISAPIGLDLGALSSSETALSIMSEIIALKHGRTGGRLIDAAGRIHDAAAA